MPASRFLDPEVAPKWRVSNSTGNKDYFVNGTVYLPKQRLELHGQIGLSVTAKSGYVIAHEFSYSGDSNFTFDAFGGTVPSGFTQSSLALVE